MSTRIMDFLKLVRDVKSTVSAGISFLETVSHSSLFTPALLGTNLLVFHGTRRILLSPFTAKASRRVSSFFLRVQLSQPYVATGHTGAFISSIFVEIGVL